MASPQRKILTIERYNLSLIWRCESWVANQDSIIRWPRRAHLASSLGEVLGAHSDDFKTKLPYVPHIRNAQIDKKMMSMNEELNCLAATLLRPSARPHERSLACTPGCNMQRALPLQREAANAASDAPYDTLGVRFQGDQGRSAQLDGVG